MRDGRVEHRILIVGPANGVIRPVSEGRTPSAR
jgi:hypothetical protein